MLMEVAVCNIMVTSIKLCILVLLSFNILPGVTFLIHFFILLGCNDGAGAAGTGAAQGTCAAALANCNADGTCGT